MRIYELMEASYIALAEDRLDDALKFDDAMEDAGGHRDDRMTCRVCRTWATDEHMLSHEHEVRVRAWHDQAQAEIEGWNEE